MVGEPASALGEILVEKQFTLAIAESCTGGLLGHQVTSVSGSSGYFLGGIISYSNATKVRHLGVDPSTLRCDGAVSAQTAGQMAQGVCRVFGSDLGISITGISGPEGGTLEKPIGLVFIGASCDTKCEVEEYHFDGGREAIRQQASEAALELAIRYLLGLGDDAR